MSDAVKRYSERQIADAYTKFRMAIKGNSVPETMDFIAATAYDALEAENVRLREALRKARSHIAAIDGTNYADDDVIIAAIGAALAASNDKGDGT